MADLLGPIPVMQELSQEEIKTTPVSVHEKVLNYVAESLGFMRKAKSLEVSGVSAAQ